MTERFFQINSQASLDGNLRLVYGSRGQKVLEPCREVFDSSLDVCIVDNNNINPKRLLVLEKDREPIYVYRPISETTEVLHYPGKSAFLGLDERSKDRGSIGNLVGKFMSRDSDRRDHIHCASVNHILNAGWHIYWAPLVDVGKVFHVRLVAERTIRYNEDPTENDAINLAEAFKKFH